MRHYKRKTQKGNVCRDIFEKAMADCILGQSIRFVAKKYDINRMTLKRYIDKKKKNPQIETGYKFLSRVHMVIPYEMEVDLAQHVKTMANMFHGLSILTCCKLAYEFAIKNELQVPDSWKKNKQAGRDWWGGFKKRQNLSIRSPEATSFARAVAFNPATLNRFYDNLSQVMNTFKFLPADIYNCDETGCTTVQKPFNVIASKGQKQVGSLTSAERGELVTLVYAASASGNVIPPMFIFPRVNYREYFIRGAPVGSIGCATKSGWINEELFVQYLQHLIKHTRCSKEHQILLILDNHESHVSLQAIDMAKENGIVMLTLPPHTSHKLQPLDRTVFGPFKKGYNRAADAWLRSNPGKTVTIYDIPELVKEAQMISMTPRNVLSGFKSTGISPFNRDLFTEIDFAPAVPTDRDMETDYNPSNVSVPTARDVSSSPESTDEFAPASVSTASNTTDTSVPSTSYISPSSLCPIPQAQPKNKRVTKRKKGSTRVLTSTPVRNTIAACLEQRLNKNKTASKSLSQVKRQSRAPCEETCLRQTSEIELMNESSDNSTNIDFDITEGDFVVARVTGKARIVNYIARIDVISGDEYECAYLKRVASKVDSNRPSFIVNSDDFAIIAKDDVIQKLPRPNVTVGSVRQSTKLTFNCNLGKFSIP